MSQFTIKICGVTREQDAAVIGESGADYLGLLIDMPSPRSLTEARAAELLRISKAPVVLLFFNKAREDVAAIVERLKPHGIQLQGQEPAKDVNWLRQRLTCEIWKGVHLPATGQGQVQVQETLADINRYDVAGADKILLDTVVKTKDGEKRGGTGITADWNAAAELVTLAQKPVILAGGLTPGNVAQAIQTVNPAGVDLSSGVESAPGVKDHDKVRAFVRNARKAGDFIF